MKRLLCFFGKHDLCKERLYPIIGYDKYIVYCVRCKKMIRIESYPDYKYDAFSQVFYIDKND